MTQEIATVEPIIEGELDDEITCKDRAGRISSLLKHYMEEVIGDDFSEENAEQIGPDVAFLLADIRHYCDHHRVDFYAASDLSYQHYLAEKAEEMMID